MKLAVIYDIHGNLPALEAVLDEIESERVDQIVVGGDVVPGPMPKECVDALLGLRLPAHFIHGNGERNLLALRAGDEPAGVPEHAVDVMRWVVEQIPPAHFAAFAAWPSTLYLDVDGVGRVLFCHATPRNDTELFTRLTPEERLRPIFEPTGAKVVVCGHTHMAFDRQVGGVRVVNAGSVGMPFGEPGAYWLLIGPGGIEPRHTRYDTAAATAEIAALDYPGAEDMALVSPRSREQMEELFESRALG